MKIALNTLLKNSRIFLVGHEMEIAVICTQKSLSPTKNFFTWEQKHGIFYPNHFERAKLLKASLQHIKTL